MNEHLKRPRPDIKRAREVGQILGKNIATKQEVLEYEAKQGRKVIDQAREANLPVEAFIERLPFFAFIRTLFTPEDIRRLKAASLQGCVDGNSHMAHQRMLEKLIEWAYNDPAKFGIDEQAKAQPVTLIFDKTIREVEE